MEPGAKTNLADFDGFERRRAEDAINRASCAACEPIS